MTADTPQDGRRYPGWVPGMELREDWLAASHEAILEPEREIVDPHHHLWVHGTPDSPAVYELEQLWADTGSGHNVVETIYIECRSYWDLSAPAHLQSVAETARVAEMARARGASRLAGIVAQTELAQAPDLLEAALDAHAEAGRGLLVGIRNSAARDPEPQRLTIPGRGVEGQYADPAYRRGAAMLGDRGLPLDCWHYHHQNRDFRDLAAAVPDTTFVLDHLGTPLGVGRFEGRRAEIFDAWRRDIDAIAALPNVVAKLGGLAMPDNGWGWAARPRPPSSDEIAEAHGPWYAHMLDRFGPARCMFESNFPVDRVSLAYPVLWNAFKKIAAGLDEAGKDAVFAGTARRVYGLR